jgi:ABC-type polar amino acid transport system ATPase subunit
MFTLARDQFLEEVALQRRELFPKLRVRENRVLAEIVLKELDRRRRADESALHVQSLQQVAGVSSRLSTVSLGLSRIPSPGRVSGAAGGRHGG